VDRMRKEGEEARNTKGNKIREEVENKEIEDEKRRQQQEEELKTKTKEIRKI